MNGVIEERDNTIIIHCMDYWLSIYRMPPIQDHEVFWVKTAIAAAMYLANQDPNRSVIDLTIGGKKCGEYSTAWDPIVAAVDMVFFIRNIDRLGIRPI